MTMSYLSSGFRGGMWSAKSPSRSGGTETTPRRASQDATISLQELEDSSVSAYTAVIDREALHLPYVEADLHYLAPMAERPRNYTFDPPPGIPRSNTAHETHRVPIYDARPIASEASLDQQGFAVLQQASAVRDFYDDDEVRTIYYPETERFLAEVTGASRVFIFD